MKTSFLTRYALLLGAALLVACGGSSEEQTAGDDVAPGAVTVTAPATEAPFSARLEAAGYVAVDFRRFPAQTPGMKAHTVCYRAKSGNSGGVIYAQQFGDDEHVSWHWYFDDQAPDSIVPVEINDDGLWDVRIYMRGGDRVEYIQDDVFTFVAPLRDDFIAHNGAASKPSAPNGAPWHCFDDDSTTVFESSGDAYIELPTPLGVEAGVLSVKLESSKQPASVEVLADGKTVQTIDLRQTTTTQVFQLDERVRDADVVRLEVKSVHGGGDAAAIAELGLR